MIFNASSFVIPPFIYLSRACNAPSSEDTASEAQTPKAIHGQRKSVGTVSGVQVKNAESEEGL